MVLIRRLAWSVTIFIGCFLLSAALVALLGLEDPDTTGMLFLIGICISLYVAIKKFRNPPEEIITGKPSNKWQGWEKANKKKSRDDELGGSSVVVQPSYKESFDRKPWHERDDIIWQGKRKAQIQYKDSDGNVTERDITMIGIMPNQYGELTLRAKCHLRDDWRTFYIDRIDSIKTARNKVYDDFSDYMSNELKI